MIPILLNCTQDTKARNVEVTRATLHVVYIVLVLNDSVHMNLERYDNVNKYILQYDSGADKMIICS